MKSAPSQVGRPRGAQVHTYKTRVRPTMATRGEVCLTRLKADLERGISYFYDRRPELSRPEARSFNP